MVSLSLDKSLKDSDMDSFGQREDHIFSGKGLVVFIKYSYVLWLEMDAEIRMVSFLSMSCRDVGTCGALKVGDICDYRLQFTNTRYI